MINHFGGLNYEQFLFLFDITLVLGLFCPLVCLFVMEPVTLGIKYDIPEYLQTVVGHVWYYCIHRF